MKFEGRISWLLWHLVFIILDELISQLMIMVDKSYPVSLSWPASLFRVWDGLLLLQRYFVLCINFNIATAY